MVHREGGAETKNISALKHTFLKLLNIKLKAMTKQQDVWECQECGQHQGRHDMWFDGGICGQCNESKRYPTNTMYEIKRAVYNYVEFFSLYKDGKILKNYSTYRGALNRMHRELFLKPKKK